ncbi:Stearoyl-CoA 9-desaturase electron transfer partner [Arthrobacter ulcerisalmonis]|uniref:Stearoyl-CoA 9-desaturase electron transfer partner n=1 Tax=Arthrobacter ulcerisalmonis TaxID=2483813 RepID=A0A3P5WZ73_9MICC|nr:ferredoxin reductase [Arthrobacter ulcerisalmonis]VDC20869.1 Stearoyl-CoA 9-desaturase electron transfer partner [Arthrobacter ulcerisalmonis]
MIRLRQLAQAASVLTTPLAPEDVLALFNPVYSARQLRGVVTRVVQETTQSATIFFRPGRGWKSHLAGQWARIGVELDGVRHWRSYSLSAAAGKDPAITVTDMGAVSGTLVRTTRPGDVLFLAPPQGDFILPEHPRPLLMVTAGSGITPVMSMIRTLVPRRPDADVVLVHSARTPGDSLFREELAELADQFPNFRLAHWFTGEQGRMDLTSPDQLDEICPDWKERAAYACGPDSFLDDAEELWKRALLTTAAAGTDLANAGAAGNLMIERFNTTFAGGVGHDGGLVTFEASDREVEADGDTPILDIGEDAGVLMPSGCRMGICHSCLTPLLAGQVRDLRTDEIHGEPGQLIQTCVSAAAGPVNLEL